MVMKNLIFFWIIFCLWVFNGNAQTNTNQLNIALRTGDLLFCSSNSGELSKAIDQATQTGKATHFDHVGIIEIQNDTVWVLHAAPKKGVCRETIGQFLIDEKDTINAIAYRLKEKYSKAIPLALIKAHSFLGEPYKYSYILKDNGYYCSEYIYKIFSADSIFTLNPMTFKDPKTAQFLMGWVDHYQKLGIPIPEGEPGCNPNGMAVSEKIDIVGAVKFIRKD